MTIDIKQFSGLQKQSSDSFFKQKSLIKKVMAGKKILCVECAQPLTLKSLKESAQLHVCCAKGCTDIQLDLAD